MCFGPELLLAGAGSVISGIGGAMDARSNMKKEAQYQLAMAENDRDVARAMNAERDATLQKLSGYGQQSNAAFLDALNKFSATNSTAGMDAATAGRVADANAVIDASGGKADAPLLASASPMSRTEAAKVLAAEIAGVKQRAALAAKASGYTDAMSQGDRHMADASGKISTIRTLANATAGGLQDRQTLVGASIDRSNMIQKPRASTNGQIFQAVGNLIGRSAGSNGANSLPNLARSFFG